MWAHQNINADWGFAWSRSSSAYWLLALICTTTCERTPRPLCPAGTATSSPAWRKGSCSVPLFESQVDGSFWRMHHLHLFCKSVYLQDQTLQCPQGKKSRHASLIIHRLSAPLPRSLLWVQCKGRNQLPWIQLPQWGDSVSWCGEVVRSETESQCWFSSALPQPRLTAVFKAVVVAMPANTQIYLYTLNTKLFGLYENNSWRSVLSCMLIHSEDMAMKNKQADLYYPL